MHRILLLILLLPNAALAQGNDPVFGGLYNAAHGTGLIEGKTAPQIIASLIRTVISFLGLLFVVLIIIGGFRWMTSGGSAEKIKEAKQLIIHSTIGLVIVLAAYVIVNFVLQAILDINQGGDGGDSGADAGG